MQPTNGQIKRPQIDWLITLLRNAHAMAGIRCQLTCANDSIHPLYNVLDAPALFSDFRFRAERGAKRNNTTEQSR